MKKVVMILICLMLSGCADSFSVGAMYFRADVSLAGETAEVREYMPMALLTWKLK